MFSWSFIHSDPRASKNYLLFLKKNIFWNSLFCCINFDYATNFVKKMFCFSFYFDFLYVYLTIVIYFMNVMNFGFILNFFLLQRKKIHALKLIFALNFSLLRHDICFQSLFVCFFSSFFKADLHSTNVSFATGTIRWQMGFFQPPFEVHKMLCVPNKFVLFVLLFYKQPLKCVQQNSCLDLLSNNLYIIWQGIHLLIKLQDRGTKK